MSGSCRHIHCVIACGASYNFGMTCSCLLSLSLQFTSKKYDAHFTFCCFFPTIPPPHSLNLFLVPSQLHKISGIVTSYMFCFAFFSDIIIFVHPVYMVTRTSTNSCNYSVAVKKLVKNCESTLNVFVYLRHYRG